MSPQPGQSTRIQTQSSTAMNLWLLPRRRQAVLEAYSASQCWLLPLAGTAANGRGTGVSHEQILVRHALDSFLRDDADAGRSVAMEWADAAVRAVEGEDLGKAHMAQIGAIIADSTAQFWGGAGREAFLQAARSLTASFWEISAGNPHSVANNWWAVTHSGLYTLAVALDELGDSTPVCGREPEEIAGWAWARIAAFCGHIGPGGGYHEGLGYLGYTFANLLPAILLHETRTKQRVVDFAPGLSRMAELLFCAAIEGAAPSDDSEAPSGWGRMLSWNDAGTSWLAGPAPLLSICLAPPAKRAALRERWDRLTGHLRPDGVVDEIHSALFFHAVFYPDAGGYSVPGPSVLSAFDSMHGLWIARNRVRDAADTVAGALARGYHPGGHTQHDAGSLRFSAAGWDWILGGGQARADARWQSRVLPADHQDSGPAMCGSAVFFTETPPVFGIDLRKVHAGYSERYVALRPDSERSQFLVLDLIDDHRNDRDWLWCVTFASWMKFEIPDGRLILRAPDGSELEAAFLWDRPIAMKVEEIPASRRTYANGKSVDYAPRQFLTARFSGSHPAILVSIAVNSLPARLHDPDTFDIAFGHDLWKRPFGLAFPGNFKSRPRGQCEKPSK